MPSPRSERAGAFTGLHRATRPLLPGNERTRRDRARTAAELGLPAGSVLRVPRPSIIVDQRNATA